MAESIDREAFLDHMKRTNRYFDVKFDIEDFPAADVVPVSELLALRDALYETDQITMRGLARLNKLIAKYGGYDNG